MNKSKPSKGLCSRAVFIDKVSAVSILYLLLSSGRIAFRCRQLRYFNSITNGGQRLLRLLGGVGLLKMKIDQVDYFFGDLRTKGGEATWFKFREKDTTEICNQVREEELSKSAFLQDLGGRHLDFERLLIYFEKKAFEEVEKSGIQISVVEWLSRDEKSDRISQPIFLVERNHWFRYLQRYAGEWGVQLKSYPHLPGWPSKGHYIVLLKFFPKTLRFLGVGLKAFWPKLGRQLRRSRPRLRASEMEKAQAVRSSKQDMLAVFYSGRELSFDPRDRSDFFWWPGSDISPSELLLYFTRPDMPLSREMAALLKEKGIRFIAMNAQAAQTPDVPVWRPSPRFIKVGLRMALRMGLALFRSFLKGDRRGLYYAIHLGPLIHQYAYWYDFFESHQVKANLNYADFVSPAYIGGQLALQRLGGVNVSYQLSNLAYAQVSIKSCPDLMFTFSSAYPSLRQIAATPVEQFVSVGYVYDGAFEAVRGRAKQRRRDLCDKGVEFVICFFDENSSNDRNAIVSDEDATFDYEFLLQHLIADKTLGLVCKPKKPNTLFQRISRIAALVKEAQDTGRLLIVDDGGIVTAMFPAEAGLIADVAVGSLVGTTATLEAYLAGTPAVLVDTLGMSSHPYYTWGRNRVVFDSWDDLFEALNRYRCDSASASGFGDWSPIIDQLDPFRDGQAGRRMGRYLRWLLTDLQNGCPRDAALQAAAAKYASLWGRDKIIG